LFRNNRVPVALLFHDNCVPLALLLRNNSFVPQQQFSRERDADGVAEDVVEDGVVEQDVT
jgi:hypothetical protein